MALLDIESISINFGGLLAVSDFSLSAEKKEIVAIIGPNGAGKTTVFNMLSGIYRPTTGDIRMHGESMIGKKPHQFSHKGMARTFQNIRLFSNVTVLENLMIVETPRLKTTLLDSCLRTKQFFKQEREIADKGMQLLRLFQLEGKAEFLAKNLPYGEQRKLEIARALMTDPEVLLLDEPCAGMIQTEIDDVIGLVRQIREMFDICIILIEHHMSVVMPLADRVKVLDFGETIAEGLPADIQADEKVIAAYLGGDFLNAESE